MGSVPNLMPQAPALPFDEFTTERLQPQDRFRAWRESISVLYDVWQTKESGAGDFHASLRAYLLGGIIVSEVGFDAQILVRDRPRLSADGIDHYLVVLHESCFVMDCPERVRTGDVQVLDLARPYMAQTGKSRGIAVMVPREAMRPLLPGDITLHDCTLGRETAPGRILGEYMRLLLRQAPGVHPAESRTVAHATAAMIAACLHPAAEAMGRARDPISRTQLARAKQFIERHLHSRTLCPDGISRALRLPRNRLYALFEPEGGVCRYIWNRRLARAYRDLRDPSSRRRGIAEIAYRWGFSSAAHFSRVFRKTYGLSPSDACAGFPAATAGIANGSAPHGPGERYQDWIRRLTIF
ncbi:MAG: helix-turn-helix domain-containing protein [Bryobacterales bacterium]|nr:helix-turn-helix domain-containing protein [Bryobacterales bacterium]